MITKAKTAFSKLPPVAQVATVAAVAFLLYITGKKLYTKFLVFTPAPLPTQSSTGVNLTQAEAQQVRALALALHTDMDGLNITRNWDIWQQLADLNDLLFRAVYNDFGNLYYSEGKGTLREWINDENFTASGFLSRPFWWTAGWVKDNVLDRMDVLNLQ